MPQGLYRGMSRAEIDRQLNLRARWPEHAAYLSRWAAESADVRQRVADRQLYGYLDVPYGEATGEKVDLFLPKSGPAPPPLLVFIHGGYWQSLDKGDFSYLAPPFLRAGIAFASVNYDLAPKVTISEIVGQTRRVIPWLASHAETYGFNAERIYVTGHSAGGHLAVMALIGAGETIKGACSVSGVYELEPLRQSYHQDVLNLDPVTVRTMSPVRLVPERAAPLILAVGGDETEEFLRQQEELAVAWRARGLSVRIVDLPGRHHFSAIDALGEVDHPLFNAVQRMIGGA
jgi:arylformamidase